ncbi:MAG: acyl-CoA dehydratase activase-related protein [Candidatus Heimdallarchaeaceae archaeon]
MVKIDGTKSQKKQKKRVGFPRALLYFYFDAMWESFFEALGAEIVLSSPTSKITKDRGVLETLDDECYSTKLYHGHVLDLIEKDLDYIFAPRFASRRKREVGCPKFVALADILKYTKDNLPPVIGPYYSTSRENHGFWRLVKIIFEIGFKFTRNPFRIIYAALKSRRDHRISMREKSINEETLTKWENSEILLNDEPLIENGETPLKVALVGHTYVLNDDFASLGVRQKLQKLGVDVITSEQMPRNLLARQLLRLSMENYGLDFAEPEKLTKKELKEHILGKSDYLYFEFEHEIVGTAMHFLENNTIDGILMLVNFICGPVSVSMEYAKQFAKKIKAETPMAILTLDAHTGEAGFQTRLEAFSDILRMKKTTGAIPDSVKSVSGSIFEVEMN